MWRRLQPALLRPPLESYSKLDLGPSIPVARVAQALLPVLLRPSLESCGTLDLEPPIWLVPVADASACALSFPTCIKLRSCLTSPQPSRSSSPVRSSCSSFPAPPSSTSSAAPSARAAKQALSPLPESLSAPWSIPPPLPSASPRSSSHPHAPFTSSNSPERSI